MVVREDGRDIECERTQVIDAATHALAIAAAV
jgi:hypothetical protein